MGATGILYDPLFLEHTTGTGHPETPRRLTHIVHTLQEKGLWNQVEHPAVPPADRSVLERIHPRDYISHIETACISGQPFVDTPDCAIGYDSYSVALAAAGATVEGVRLILEGSLTNGMVLTRPPGHHAEIHQAMGFCFFNNIALAARYALDEWQLNRIVILDFDVHHGNGTQHIFETDSRVLYISTHQYPFYPGTGTKEETGLGDGLGTTRNFPLPGGTRDDVFLDIYQNSVPDLVARFQPELILLSAGFDAHQLDPLGGLKISTEAFATISTLFQAWADEWCQGRLLSVLEGGYHWEALADSVACHVEALIRSENT
ncbi:MAG: histone deacetylase [Candidatus Neomarinimicrobiota bacterium]|nr:MAG: histone deacetylase [Candidatus Neomarinimicrobiota bacterium]